jgi:hypothetical protein
MHRPAAKMTVTYKESPFTLSGSLGLAIIMLILKLEIQEVFPHGK